MDFDDNHNLVLFKARFSAVVFNLMIKPIESFVIGNLCFSVLFILN